MAMAGRGVLAIWNGIAPEAEADFVAWHVREHIPERVSLPGFLRGRRYASQDASPAYFNFYETEGSHVLTSDAYKARLDAPSDWTRQVVRHFTDTSRTVCNVAMSVGVGGAGWIETLRISGPVPADFGDAAASVLKSAMEQPGIVAVHLLEGEHQASRSESAEKAMRAQPDEVVDWIALVEAVDQAPLEAMRPTLDVAERLRQAGAAGAVRRGIYRLQYSLTHAEILAQPVRR
jgi:hypothetical protein